jgi:hypothetical protein
MLPIVSWSALDVASTLLHGHARAVKAVNADAARVSEQTEKRQATTHNMFITYIIGHRSSSAVLVRKEESLMGSQILQKEGSCGQVQKK